MVGPEIASDSRPSTISVPVTNRPKLSAATTPKLDVLWFQSRIVANAAPTSPTAPRPAIGMRSPGSRNDSATIAAMPAAVTHAIGTIAFREPFMAEGSWLMAHG